MTPEQFVYWLQGFVEVSKPETWNRAEGDQHENKMWEEIKRHLLLVLNRVSPEEVMKAKMEAMKETARQQLKDMITHYPLPPIPTAAPVVDWTKQASLTYPPGTMRC